MSQNDKLFSAPYGQALSDAVAELLKSGQPIIHNHRDYCGMGLEYDHGKFRYGTVYDGAMEKAEMEFSTQQEFTLWLSQQTDLSLQGRAPWSGNQRIDRERLIEALEYAGIHFVDTQSK